METKNLEEQISELITTELEKRGIFTNVKECKVDLDKQRISFETEPFHTTPTIFKEIWVSNFGSFIKYEELNKYYDITLNLHFSYRYFEGGSNGCNLMNMKFRYFEKGHQLFLFEVL